MKKVSRKFLFVATMIAMIAMLISACSGGASPIVSDLVGGGKGLASPVDFTGVIQSINGNQWVVNGQTITVDPAVVKNGPFKVGDTVQVEVQVQINGSVVVTKVEPPSSAPVAAASQPAVVPSETLDASGAPDSVSASETPDASKAPEPASASETPDPNGGSKEISGKVDSITGNSVVIGGQTYQISNAAEIKNQIQAGDSVKVHFILNADGTMTITELEIVTLEQTGQSLDGNSGIGGSSSSSDVNSGSNSTGASVSNGHDNSPDTGTSASHDSPDTSNSGSPDTHSSGSGGSESPDSSGSGS